MTVSIHQLQILHAQPIAHTVNGEDAVDQGRRRTYCNEGIHIGRAVKQGGKTFGIIGAVHIDHRQAQKELGQGEPHRIVRSV